MQPLRPLAALAACFVFSGCTGAVRDGQFACHTPGSTSECPPGLRCGLGAASASELRCYETAGVGLDAGLDGSPLDARADATDPDASPPDAREAGRPDAGPPPLECPLAPSCDAPCVVTPPFEVPFEVELATDRASPPGPLALVCDSASPAGDGPPQGVIALSLPGAGAQRILMTLRHDRTEVRDTLLEVRRDCASTEDAECFDDIDGLDPSEQSDGTAFATGGETIYVVVTAAARARPDTGRYRLGAIVLDVDAPRIDELLAVVRPSSDVQLRLEGRFTFWDDDADLGEVELTFLDVDGPVDLNEDGRVDDRDSMRVVTPFDGVIQGTLIPFDTSTPRLDRLNVTHVRAVALDFEGHRSNPFTAPIEYRVAEGEPCAAPFACEDTFSCDAGTCVVSAATRAACTMAERVSIPAPTTTATATTRSGTVGGLGSNDFVSIECLGTRGPEDVYLVEVPEGGPYDLVARTDVPGTPEWVYSFVYIRRSCDSPSSELACNSIDTTPDYRGAAAVENAAPGSYAVIIERYARGTTPAPSETYAVELALRPVLPTGSTCDEAGRDNRCATRACVGGRCP